LENDQGAPSSAAGGAAWFDVVGRDRDGIYGRQFKQRVESLDIEQVVTSRRSPWQNPHVERVIGSIRRECLDHVIVLNEQHLRRILPMAQPSDQDPRKSR